MVVVVLGLNGNLMVVSVLYVRVGVKCMLEFDVLVIV